MEENLTVEVVEQIDYTNILHDIENSIDTNTSILSDISSSSAITAKSIQNIETNMNILIMFFIIFLCFEIVKIRGERR